METTSATDRNRSLTDEQRRELAAELQHLVVTHRRRLRREQALFRSLPLHQRSSARRRQLARQAAQTAFQVCGAASRALDALADGSYGTCDRCRCAIAFDQLRVSPLSRRCGECAPA